MKFNQIGAQARLVPSMSDQFFKLANHLVKLSETNKEELSVVAGVILICCACIESYVNEVIRFNTFSQSKEDNDNIKNFLLKFKKNPQRQLVELSKLKKSKKINKGRQDSLKLLFGLRGLLAHFDPQEEHPEITRTSLQRLDVLINKARKIDADCSLDKILNYSCSQWAFDLVNDIIGRLYLSGYQPSRGRWLRIIKTRILPTAREDSLQ